MQLLDCVAGLAPGTRRPFRRVPLHLRVCIGPRSRPATARCLVAHHRGRTETVAASQIASGRRQQPKRDPVAPMPSAVDEHERGSTGSGERGEVRERDGCDCERCNCPTTRGATCADHRSPSSVGSPPLFSRSVANSTSFDGACLPSRLAAASFPRYHAGADVDAIRRLHARRKAETHGGARL